MADLFEQAGQRYQIDPLLGRAIAKVESGFNPRAVAPDGGRGTMQIMPQHYARLGITDPHNDSQNIPGGFSILNDALNAAGGDVTTALRIYQGGTDQSKWGPKNAAYPYKVAAAYQALKKDQPAVATQDASPDDIIAHLKKNLSGASPAPSTAPTPEDDIIAHLRSQLPKAADAAATTPAPAATTPAPSKPASFREFLTAPKAPEAPEPPPAMLNGQPVAEGRPAGMGTQAVASLPTDPEAQRRVFARALYPDLPADQAQARVTRINGRLVATDDKGQPYFVEPASPSLSHPSTLLPNNLAPWIASGAGPAIPAAGGLLAGLATGPTSIVAGVPAAAAGAGLGDVGRQLLARQLDPGGANTPIDLWQTGKEAGLAAGGQLGGALIGRMMAPNRLGVAAADVNALRGGGLATAQAAYDRARAQGVDLTAGQATGLRSIVGAEDAARNVLPGSQDMAQAFYDRQTGQLTRAGQDMLNRVSPVADKTDAAMQFQQGAQDAITAARQQANAAARPAYQAAQGAGQVMSPDLAQLSEVPAVSQAMDRARAAYQNLYRRPAPETPDFALWDLTKRQLDDAHGVAASAGERTDAMAIDSLRGDLTQHLDTAYPTYGQARATAAPGQQLAARLEDAGTGRTAGMGGDERAKAILAPVFDQNNPRAVAEARDAFHAAGRGDEWNAGVRAYVQDAFDAASKGSQGLNATTLRKQIWGNTNVRDNLQAAMTPQAFQGFENFLRTVEDVSRTLPMNSLTEPRKEAANRLIGIANEGEVTRGLRMLGNVASPNVLNILRDSANRLADFNAGRNLQGITQALFTPDGMQMLREMSQVSPGTQRAVGTASQLVSRLLSGRPDSPGTPPPAGLPGQPALARP